MFANGSGILQMGLGSAAAGRWLQQTNVNKAQIKPANQKARQAGPVPAKALTMVVSSGRAQERILEKGCMLQTQSASSATCATLVMHQSSVSQELVMG